MPDTVVVLGQTFRTKVVDRDEAMFRGDGDNTLGATNLDEQIIRVRAVGAGGVSEDQARETALHEVLHAVLYLYGLVDRVKGHQAERLVKVLAPALLDTLRRNPEFVRHLMDGVDG